MPEVAEAVTVSEPVAAAGPPAPAPETPEAIPDDFASLPAKTQDEIRALRSEAAASRKKAKTAADDAVKGIRDAIAKALGDDDDDPVKAAKTAADERDAAKAVNKNLAAENAVLRIATKHGADPSRLTDSRSFMKTLEAIDPAADDFATQVDTAIRAAVEANPSLKAGIPAPARSGGTVGGSAPAQQSSDPQQRSRDYYAAQSTK